MVPDSIVAPVRFRYDDGDHLSLCPAEFRSAEHECPVEVAGSDGRCNTRLKFTRRGLES
jgi:hypothetical protein